LADELIDIYDENNNPLGVQKMKSEAHRKGLWHRASHVWIYNSKGEMLLQLRAKDKEMYPDKWDISAAGHAGAGEDPIATALREVKEELGLSINAADLEYFGIRDTSTVQGSLINKEHQSIYLLKFDGDIRSLHAQKEEIQRIKFLDINRIERDVVAESKEYVFHHGRYWLMMINAVRKRLNPK
jgi:isopentenyldiphosphate isomerase